MPRQRKLDVETSAELEEAGLKGEQHARQIQSGGHDPDEGYGQKLSHDDLPRRHRGRKKRLQRATLLFSRRHVDGRVEGTEQRHSDQQQGQESPESVTAQFLRPSHRRIGDDQRLGELGWKSAFRESPGEQRIVPVPQGLGQDRPRPQRTLISRVVEHGSVLRGFPLG